MSLRVLVALVCSQYFVAAIRVNAPTGSIEGTTGVDANTFQSIPFGDVIRFSQAKRVPAWTDTFDATKVGPGCPQVCDLPMYTCPDTQAEQCLLLNVYTPLNANSGPDKLPVIVYLHGGNYLQGFAGSLLYRGEKLVKQTNAIVVVPQYRMGALGYLVAPELGIDGNVGVHDQRMALEWVRDNIAAFGGDSDNVTLMGQSAGAGSTAVHLTSPASKGLFHKSFMLSNPFSIPFRNTESSAALTAKFLNITGCATRDCLDNLPMDHLLASQNDAQTDFGTISDSFLHLFLPWTPYVDGKVVPHNPLLAFKTLALDIPTVLGQVHDEALVFIHQAFQTPVSAFEYVMTASLIFGDANAKRILTRYPGPEGSKDLRPTLSQVGSEFIFNCAIRNATRSLAANNRKSGLYTYMYNHRLSFSEEGWGKDFSICASPDTTCHGAELPIVWNSAESVFPYTAAEKELAHDIGQYIGNFAYTGNPNKGPVQNSNKLVGLQRQIRDAPKVHWEDYTDKGNTLILKDGDVHMENWLTETCNFWDSIGYMIAEQQ